MLTLDRPALFGIRQMRAALAPGAAAWIAADNWL
jgi:hypothetical protein